MFQNLSALPPRNPNKIALNKENEFFIQSTKCKQGLKKQLQMNSIFTPKQECQNYIKKQEKSEFPFLKQKRASSALQNQQENYSPHVLNLLEKNKRQGLVISSGSNSTKARKTLKLNSNNANQSPYFQKENKENCITINNYQNNQCIKGEKIKKRSFSSRSSLNQNNSRVPTQEDNNSNKNSSQQLVRKSSTQGSNNNRRILQDISNEQKTINIDQSVKQIQQNGEVQIIPKNLSITQEEMKMRKYMDQRRWFCMSRPQYQRSCGISSLISCFNYLFSTLGCGDLQPISTEEAIQKLKIVKGNQLFKNVEFGAFTGNYTLINWWKKLLQIYNLSGSAYMFWKVRGSDQTRNRNADQALDDLKKGLQGEQVAYIYHAYDHYFCPIGFEETPGRAIDAYKKKSEIDPKSTETWIIIGETARTYPCFHLRKWSDIESCRERKKTSGNMHCIMAFTKKRDKLIQPNTLSRNIPSKLKEQNNTSSQINDEKLNQERENKIDINSDSENNEDQKWEEKELVSFLSDDKQEVSDDEIQLGEINGITKQQQDDGDGDGDDDDDEEYDL